MTKPYEFRNPDGTLRLDEALGERYVRHYVKILESSDAQFREMQLGIAAQSADEDRDVPWQDRRGTVTPDGWLVTPEGSGPAAASSCQELALRPDFCWDVCGYYARLGVHWRATVKQIRAAYLGKDPSQADESLFYAMSQLVDPQVRRAYDLMPVGGLFMLDRDVREKIEHVAAMAATRANAEAFMNGEYDAPVVTYENVLKDWGFEKGVSPEEARERAFAEHEPFRAGDGPDALGSSRPEWQRTWTWYQMSDPDDDWSEDGLPSPGVLEQWQPMVAAALSRLGIRRARFGVGIWPGHGVKVWRDSNQSCIIFIGRGLLTQQMAREAAMGYMARISHTEHSTHTGRKERIYADPR